MLRMMLPERSGMKNTDTLRWYSLQMATGGAVCPTIIGDHQNRITDYTAVVVQNEVVQPGESDRVC